MSICSCLGIEVAVRGGGRGDTGGEHSEGAS